MSMNKTTCSWWHTFCSRALFTSAGGKLPPACERALINSRRASQQVQRPPLDSNAADSVPHSFLLPRKSSTAPEVCKGAVCSGALEVCNMVGVVCVDARRVWPRSAALCSLPSVQEQLLHDNSIHVSSGTRAF
jgi:hypothetical protein